MNQLTPSPTSEYFTRPARKPNVLIWLPLSPPPEMNDPRRPTRLEQAAVRPHDPVPLASPLFPSGSHWKQLQLCSLKVRFAADDAEKTLPVLNRVPGWNHDQQTKIDNYAKQLDITAAELLNISDDDLFDRAPRFDDLLRSLKECISSNIPETRLAADTISTATATTIPPVILASDELTTSSTKRPLSPTSSDSGNHTKVRPIASDNSPQHTPETGTYLPDAYFSGDKTEACLEDNPRDMMKVFIAKTLSLFEQDIAKVKWSPCYSKLRLKRDAPETMTFTLKKKKINVQNDGAIVLRDDNKMIWFDRDTPKVIDGKPPKPKVMKTILSIEGKRKEASNEWAFAGQIFSEMLGQVCHPTLYHMDPGQYFEAFVIHVRHTNARFFYCKFPVAYLRNIARHGYDYTNIPGSQGVKLEHTKPFQLRDPGPRQAFFKELCKLITYLTSGSSHVPFLWDHPKSPLRTDALETFNVHADNAQHWPEPPATWEPCDYPLDDTHSILEDSSRPPSTASNYSADPTYVPRSSGSEED